MSQVWQQVTVAVAGEQEQDAANLLQELGALAVTSQGSQGQVWLESGVADLPQWQKVELTGLFDSSADLSWICAQLKQHLCVTAHSERLADQDWVTLSQQQMKQIKAGRRLWICPGDTDCADLPGITLKLDPGLAFGSGTHPTTAMYLDWLSRVPPARGTILDYGCGSGVLSIAALLLGFEQAVAVDIDVQAIRATKENAQKNGVSERMLVQHPDQLVSDLQADVVIANILAGTIGTVSGELRRRLRPGGWLVLSGILRDQVDVLVNECFGRYKFVQWQREQWVLLAAEN